MGGPTQSVAQSVVEQKVDHLLACIQPNAPSELRRLTIASYVCDLIRRCFANQRQVEAFTFGSVPLRTYLPDGDIDISLFFPLDGAADPLKDTWNMQLLKALERESARRDAPFRIRNCQIIQAEFKLVKFVVADVVVDVSFNALGGLCTVAFLEWADRTIGRNHLFKRSIVLVKAWCYYESRLLGAHHGLISSYALEAMVLYVFNRHGTELHSPLQVLHKFLREFAAFEWEKYALSLVGPIPLSALPNLGLARDGLPQEPSLLDPKELRDAVQRFSVQPAVAVAALDALLPSLADARGGLEGAKPPSLSVALPQKFLNIMDPLLPNNNLGRSVSKASFARIRRALAFGAEQLEHILQMEPLAASEGIAAYFENTWRSPTRMAADNQMFQNRLAAGGPTFQGHHHQQHQQHNAARRRSSSIPRSGGSTASRAFHHRQLSSNSLSEMANEKSTSTVREQQQQEDASAGGRPPVSTGGAARDPSVSSPDGPRGTPGASLSVTPTLSPRSAAGSAGAVGGEVAGDDGGSSTAAVPRPHHTSHHGSPSVSNMHHQAVSMTPGGFVLGGQACQWAVAGQHGALVAMLPPAPSHYAPPLIAGDGRRTAFQSSLPTSPILPAPSVALPTTTGGTGRQKGTLGAGNSGASPFPSRDIFMADLDAVMCNLDIAREWQLRSTGATQSSGTAGTGGATGAITAAPGDLGTTLAGGNGVGHAATEHVPRHLAVSSLDTEKPQAAQSADDALKAAMASLPPVRVTSMGPRDSYASVIAQGLTPLTVPNSLEASLEVSAACSAAASVASSAANTPRSPFNRTTTPVGSSPKRSQQQHGGVIQFSQQHSKQPGSARPPLPTKSKTAAVPAGASTCPGNANGSGASTPTYASTAADASASPLGPPTSNAGVIPPAPLSTAAEEKKRGAGTTAGKGASAPATGVSNPSEGALPQGTAPVSGVGGLGRGSWSAIAGRPSRLGQMHGGGGNSPSNSPRGPSAGPPPRQHASGSASASDSVTATPSNSRGASSVNLSALLLHQLASDQASSAPESSPSSNAATIDPDDPKAWPPVSIIATKPILTAAGASNLASSVDGGSTTGPVWGSVPASIKSEASTPSGASPRVGSWAAAAAASPKRQQVFSKSAASGGGTAAAVGQKSRRAGHSPTKERVGKEQKNNKKFNLKKDEFPTL